MNDEQKIVELLKACRRKEQQAQMALYNLYYKAMYNTALRIVNDADDAEDVMQNAFIKAFDNLDKYRFEAKFGAWLKRITVNEAISWLRQKRSFKPVYKLEEIPDEPQNDCLDNSADVQKILNAMSELKDNYRIAFSLYYIEGYDYEEMMKIMNISYANARAIVSRARQKIKRKLQT